MIQFGFNLNMRSSPKAIKTMGKELLGTGEFSAVEVAYSNHMEGTDSSLYQSAIEEIVKAYQPRVFVHLPDFNLAEENSTIRYAIAEEFENCCRYAKDLNCHEMIVHSGQKLAIHVPIYHEDGSRHTREEIIAKTWRLSVEMMQKCCDTASHYGIQIDTENLAQNMQINSGKDLVKYIEEVSRDNLKVVFDTGHSNCNGLDVGADMLEARKYLSHLHLHDNNKMKDEHLPVGQGTICWEDILRALNNMDYKGVYMMEFYHCTTENFKSSKEALLSYLS